MSETKKLEREELYMPSERFVTWDDWVPKLGEKVYCFWRKLYTMCDRTDNLGYGVIKDSIENLAKRLGMSKSTLYRLVKPMWDYCLIDFGRYEEWSGGSKPVNLFVYAYPKNDKNLAASTLIKYRDYEKDYVSPERVHAIKGGRPRNQRPNPPVLEETGINSTEELDRINDADSSLFDGFQNENGEGSKNETPSVSEPKHINILNILSNTLNTLCNTLNTFNQNINNNHSFNSSSSNDRVIKFDNKSKPKLKNNDVEELKNSHFALEAVDIFLEDQEWSNGLRNLAIQKLHKANCYQDINRTDIPKAYDEFLKATEIYEEQGKPVSCYAGLFVHHIEKIQNEKSIKKSKKTLKNPVIPTANVPFYNWLETAN
ncbi:hypothetical protein [Peribacillus frigoritolerans]|uniref:Helix-turn-helix domain-containing protein n=1 Tax=Peribacillus castrilensis TaxID=2897690 RepID=A0AAW9NQ85_9BACI|nr:hypothetical protein [Peribacillus castrilensis]